MTCTNENQDPEGINTECRLCHGSGEVTITPAGAGDKEADAYGCPLCIERERDETEASISVRTKALEDCLKKLITRIELGTDCMNGTITRLDLDDEIATADSLIGHWPTFVRPVDQRP